jgi:hypothetical protein
MSKSAFSESALAQKLFVAARKQGYTLELMDELVEKRQDLFHKMFLIQLGYVEVVPIKHLPDPSPVLSSVLPLSFDVTRQSSEVPPLIVPVGTIDVPATEFRFVARDHFVINTGENVQVEIARFGENFTTRFLGKVEQPFGGSTLRYGDLSRAAEHDSVIAELGGEERAQTTLVECFSCMLTHAQENKKNNTVPDRRSHVFYVPDINEVICAVDFRWYDDGCHMYAYPTSIADKWPEGTRIYYRKIR